LQRLQQVPHARWQRFGLDDLRHLAAHAPLQSESYIKFIIYLTYIGVNQNKINLIITIRHKIILKLFLGFLYEVEA
jgi:hypothetical protein